MDERKNDITDAPLISCNCVAVIEVVTGTSGDDKREMSEEQSSIDCGVIFYD